jgi:hypothetical protein
MTKFGRVIKFKKIVLASVVCAVVVGASVNPNFIFLSF